MLFKSKHHKKYENIVFVDTENIGCAFPSQLPPDVFVYVFVRYLDLHSKILKQLQSFESQVEIINIHDICLKFQTKNIMDFCIVAKMSEVIQNLGSQPYLYILSKDKGYDAVIEFYKRHYAYRHILRYPANLINYCFQKENIPLSQEILTALSQYSTMEEVKKHLSKTQRQELYLVEYIEPISQTRLFIEYDLYKGCFSLYVSEKKQGKYKTLQAALNQFYELQSTYQYQKYDSHEMLLKLEHQNLNGFITKSMIKNISI